MPTRKTNRVTRSSTRKSHEIAEALHRIQGLESEMAHVIHEMQEKVRQLECLNEFSSLMSSSLDIQVVQQKALEATCKLLSCETAELLIVDRATGELYWKTEEKDIRISIDNQSIPGYVAMTTEGVIVNHVGQDTRFKKGKLPKGTSQVKTTVCVPLQAKNQTIGVLQAINKLPSVPNRPSAHQWPDFYENDKKLLETLSHSTSIAIENARLYSEIKKNFFETVEALAEAIEKKDHYTGGHTKRVVYYAECISKYMSLTPTELERVRLAAILHDVGKIGIEDKILKKESGLDPAEWKIMQKHPDLGFDILARVEGLKDVVGGTRYHHERWDGKGYPLGLKGEEIPRIARIIAVADTYDAMVSTRPYRKGIDPKTAFDEIVRYRGSQFDPQVVDAFVEAFRHEKMGKGSGGSTSGTSLPSRSGRGSSAGGQSSPTGSSAEEQSEAPSMGPDLLSNCD